MGLKKSIEELIKERPYVLFIPVLALVGFMYVYPISTLLIETFSHGVEGIGLDNFAETFADGRFWDAVENSIVWTGGNMAVQLSVALGIAVLLNRKFKGRSISQTLILAPWIIPMAAAVVIWQWLLMPTIGFINQSMIELGIIASPIAFFSDPNLAMGTLIGINSWKYIPIGVVFVLAALRTIPEEVYEAASLDGAGSFRQFKDITFPMIGPRLWFVGIILFAWNFSSFDLIWLTTRGGPDVTGTTTLPVYIYRNMFVTFQRERAFVAGFIMMLVVLIFAIFYFRYMLGGEE